MDGFLPMHPFRFLSRSEIQPDILVEKPCRRRPRFQDRGRSLAKKWLRMTRPRKWGTEKRVQDGTFSDSRHHNGNFSSGADFPVRFGTVFFGNDEINGMTRWSRLGQARCAGWPSACSQCGRRGVCVQTICQSPVRGMPGDGHGMGCAKHLHRRVEA